MTFYAVAAETTTVDALGNLKTALEMVWGQMTTCVNTISGSPLLLLAVAIPVAGAVIGLAKRLLRFGGRRR
ncbi:MAG: hypothetical protein K2L10_05440 [Ruminococcus sp.]|nr:hypothetical protein [Ruminococcus sp.]